MKKLVLFLIMIIAGISAPIMHSGEIKEAQYPEQVDLEDPTVVIDEDDEETAPGAFAAGVALGQLERRPYYGPRTFHPVNRPRLNDGVIEPARGERPFGRGGFARGRGFRGGLRRR